MWFRVDDGSVVFATYFVHVQVDRQNESIMQKLLPYQVEADGIVVYPEDDSQKLEAILKDLGLSYKVEKLNHDPAHVAKTQGVKYASRSEAIEHILNDKEPESMIIPNLKKKLQEKEEKIVQLTNELNLLKQKHALFEERISKLEKFKEMVKV